MVGHNENTQVAVAFMHENSLMEESAPLLKMPEKVPLHKIDCVINGCDQTVYGLLATRTGYWRRRYTGRWRRLIGWRLSRWTSCPAPLPPTTFPW